MQYFDLMIFNMVIILVCLSVEQLYAIHHPTKTHKRTPANTIKAASLYLVISWANGVVNGWYLLVFQNKQLIDGNTFARCYFEVQSILQFYYFAMRIEHCHPRYKRYSILPAIIETIENRL